jgi:methylenetetrahydrofolate reductase (NADPH)
MMNKDDSLRAKLDRGDFVVTAEVTPRLSASAADLIEQAQPLKGLVDAVNVTDGAGARVAMSSLAASALLRQDGIEPIMQMTCRDRNRIAIAADLIGAAAHGIQNLLVLKGDDPAGGDEPEAKPVFDLDSQDIIVMARRMSDEGKLPSGREFTSRPDFNVGAADVPFDPPADWKPDRLREKIDAGIGFVQTQFCFDPSLAKRYFDRLDAFGLLDRTSIIVGIGPIISARSARWMNGNLFGVTVPDPVVKRLEDAADEAAEGLALCVELIDAYKNMPGVAGVHVMAPAQGAQRIADAVATALPGRLSA